MNTGKAKVAGGESFLWGVWRQERDPHWFVCSEGSSGKWGRPLILWGQARRPWEQAGLQASTVDVKDPSGSGYWGFPLCWPAGLRGIAVLKSSHTSEGWRGARPALVGSTGSLQWRQRRCQQRERARRVGAGPGSPERPLSDTCGPTPLLSLAETGREELEFPTVCFQIAATKAESRARQVLQTASPGSPQGQHLVRPAAAFVREGRLIPPELPSTASPLAVFSTPLLPTSF